MRVSGFIILLHNEMGKKCPTLVRLPQLPAEAWWDLSVALYHSRNGGSSMERYTGTKIVEAEPMTAYAADGRLNHQISWDGITADGYLVRYPDGYESWSPKAIFEAAYRRLDAMTFGLAITALKMGLKIRLPHWQPDVFISLQRPDEHSKMTHEYLYVTSRYGLVPWNPTQIEILSEKWMIAD